MIKEGQIECTEKLFKVVENGEEFYPENIILGQGHVAMSTFTISRKNMITIVECPDEYPLKRLFKDTYGPYSIESFVGMVVSMTSVIRRITSNTMRMFMRKVWLMKQLHELIENSLQMVIKSSKLVISVYSKSIDVINTIESRKIVDKRMVKYINISLESVRRVHQKIIEIISSDTKFLKLLPPELLLRFVKDASPWMISKIQCLPWIDPGVALFASPGYNHYWTTFWCDFLKRNLRLNHDICFAITEYMPMPIRGETFLEFIHRKYNFKTGTYKGKILFDIEPYYDPTYYRYTGNEHWFEYNIILK